MEPSLVSEITEDREYMECVKDILCHPVFQSMDQYIQHGTTTCKTHCMQVSYLGYKLCKQLGGNWRSAARAGLLHDLFLYDWHTHAKETGQYFHGFTHPKAALTLVPPTSKAGYAVTCADKYCSTVETTARFKHWIRMCLFAQPARR